MVSQAHKVPVVSDQLIAGILSLYFQHPIYQQFDLLYSNHQGHCYQVYTHLVLYDQLEILEQYSDGPIRPGLI
ncbi:hypothetical protein BpHYR1_013679 [Brachionus plicatilis]|uniref:Uncharacterized protein n=1 Tax=Brachionus plicatilis TaxID=10195 RepID=A0A3M7SXS6_BRAPC|nr:hypothetical protein BpHYR1_013679 [Brachionus plicatilis]